MLIKKITINLNCFLYAVIIFLFAGKLFQDLFSAEDGHSLIYYTLVGVIPLISLIILVGMLRRKEWARICAIPWNIGVALLFILLDLIRLFYFSSSYGAKQSIFEYLDIEILLHIVFGLSLIFIAILFSFKSYRDFFRKHGVIRS